MRNKKFASNVHRENNFNVLKTAGVYGPNNVGKTCLVKCIRAIKSVLLDKESGLLRNIFSNDEVCKLGVTFLAQGRKFSYDFWYNAKNGEYVYESFTEILKDQYGNEKEVLWLKRDTIKEEYYCIVEDAKKMLEGLPNKINDKLGIIASIKIHTTQGAENVRYGNEVPESVSDELLLRNLKLFDGDYLTRAAILLFHPTPEQYVTGAYIKIGYFALVDYEGVQRTETNMLTRGIVRELLLNAINHKEYATGVPIQVSVYDDKIEIFNMGSWSKRVPTDERVYEKHESVPNNPKMADVSFPSGDVESWGRGFLKIKAECNKIKAPLPVIDAKNDAVSITATGCEKYMSLLRYGQYGQVGVDGVWREKETQNDKRGDELKEDINLIQKNEISLKEVLKGVLNQKDYEKTLPIIEYLETKASITTQTTKQITGKSSATAWRYLQILVKADVLEADGNTNNAEYVVKDIYR